MCELVAFVVLVAALFVFLSAIAFWPRRARPGASPRRRMNSFEGCKCGGTMAGPGFACVCFTEYTPTQRDWSKQP